MVRNTERVPPARGVRRAPWIGVSAVVLGRGLCCIWALQATVSLRCKSWAMSRSTAPSPVLVLAVCRTRGANSARDLGAGLRSILLRGSESGMVRASCGKGPEAGAGLSVCRRLRCRTRHGAHDEMRVVARRMFGVPSNLVMDQYFGRTDPCPRTVQASFLPCARRGSDGHRKQASPGHGPMGAVQHKRTCQVQKHNVSASNSADACQRPRQAKGLVPEMARHSHWPGPGSRGGNDCGGGGGGGLGWGLNRPRPLISRVRGGNTAGAVPVHCGSSFCMSMKTRAPNAPKHNSSGAPQPRHASPTLELHGTASCTKCPRNTPRPRALEAPLCWSTPVPRVFGGSLKLGARYFQRYEDFELRPPTGESAPSPAQSRRPGQFNWRSQSDSNPQLFDRASATWVAQLRAEPAI